MMPPTPSTSSVAPISSGATSGASRAKKALRSTASVMDDDCAGRGRHHHSGSAVEDAERPRALEHLAGGSGQPGVAEPNDQEDDNHDHREFDEGKGGHLLERDHRG